MRVLINYLVVVTLILSWTGQSAAAAENHAFFWCHVHHDNGENKAARNFYSKVFKGKLEYKTNYENAFRARVAARILQSNPKGNSICFYNKAPGEAWRELDEYALARKIANEGTIEFIDWAY